MRWLTILAVGAPCLAGFVPAGRAGAAEDAVQQAVAAISRCATLAQASRAIADAKLSTADRARLTAALSQPPLAAKLQGLRASALAEANRSAKMAADARTAELNRLAAQRLATRNTALSARIQLLRTEAGKHRALPLRSAPITPQMTAHLSAPRPETKGTITSVSPDPISGGAELTINGRDFGGSHGQVDLALLTTRLVVACSISSWSPTRVVAVVPLGIDALIPEGGEGARVWLRTAGEEIGPLADIRVAPATVPAISGVSSETIEPGQLLIVDGTGFGTTQGQVRFRFPALGQTQDGIVDLWTETGIVAHLREDLERMPRELACTMEVTTPAGRTASRRLTFHATLRYVTLFETESFVAPYRGSNYVDGWYYDTPGVFIQDLRNEWVVFTSSTTLHTDPDFTRCSYAGRPASGSSHPMGSLRLEARQADWTCVCSAGLEIQGPRGIPWE